MSKRQTDSVRSTVRARMIARVGRGRPHAARSRLRLVEAAAPTTRRRDATARERLQFADFFCGVGGYSLGCMHAGLAPLVAFDIDPVVIEQYKANLGSHAHVLDLGGASAADVLRFTRGVTPDVIVGGPPCQGFSFIGKRDPADPRSELTRRFAQLVVELQPKAFALENVPGIFSMGSIANEVRDLLRAGGYENADWLTLNAADFGVPQKRLRAVLLGSLSGVIPTLEALRPTDIPIVTVGEALRGLPRPRARSTVHKNAYVPYVEAPEPGSYDALMRSERGAVSGCQVTEHAADTLERFKKLGRGEVDPETSCRRLDPRGFAPALRAGTRDRTACRPVHPTATRVITVREAARLHTFPDAFDFSEVVSLGHVQIGNSVPPRLGAAIGRWLSAAAGASRTSSAAAASA